MTRWPELAHSAEGGCGTPGRAWHCQRGPGRAEPPARVAGWTAGSSMRLHARSQRWGLACSMKAACAQPAAIRRHTRPPPGMSWGPTGAALLRLARRKQ